MYVCIFVCMDVFDHLYILHKRTTIWWKTLYYLLDLAFFVSQILWMKVVFCCITCRDNLLKRQFKPFSYEYSYSAQNLLENDVSYHVILRKCKNHVFLFARTTGQQFFESKPWKMQKFQFFFHFTFWCEIAPEKQVLL